MADFVTLVNLLLARLNEVLLDPLGDGFESARGPQALAKDAVNSAVRLILQDGQEWPFLKVTAVQTLTEGQSLYDYPDDYSSADFETFYLKKSPTLNNSPRHLPAITYEDYIQNYRARDDEGGNSLPEKVFQTYQNSFGVTPPPNGDYEVEYVYWSFPVDLVNPTDVCIVPDRFNHVILDGAMVFMMRFRSNDESAMIHQESFDKGIRAMRRVLLDEPFVVRSTVINRNEMNAR